MSKHDETTEHVNRAATSRRLRAVRRLKRIRREGHTWKVVTVGLVAAIGTGSVLAATTGQSPAEASSAEPFDLVQASAEVDEAIDVLDEQREHRKAAEAVLAEKQEAAEVAAAEEAEALEQAEQEAAEEAAEAERQAEQEAAEEAAPDWISPSDSAVTSGYGERWGRLHAGMDFGNDTGESIWTIGDGTVTHAGWMEGYGNMVIVDHGDGVETAYAHASEVLVSVGDEVSQGDELSLTGSTGNSTGPHLHFEVRVDGEAVDPQGWLTDHGVDL